MEILVTMDGGLVPLDLQSVIATMIKAQTSQGSPGPSSSDAMPSQQATYLQQEPLSDELPRTVTGEFDVEMFTEERKNFPCLWTTSLRSYHEKHTKQNSWMVLSDKFGINGKDEVALFHIVSLSPIFVLQEHLDFSRSISGTPMLYILGFAYCSEIVCENPQSNISLFL